MARVGSYSFHYMLYGENNIKAAIPADIVRRAMGTAPFATSYLHLVDCSREFVDHYSQILSATKVETIVESASDIRKSNFLHEYDNPVLITHNWPKTLYAITRLIKSRFPSVIIDEVPPLFDRFPKPFDYKPSLFDKVLTNHIILNLLMLRYKANVKTHTIYAPNSPNSAALLRSTYGIKHHFVTYAPVDPEVFFFKQNDNRSDLLLYAPSDISLIPWELMRRLNKLFSFECIQVVSGSNTRDIARTEIRDAKKIIINDFIPRSDFKQLLDDAMFAIIPERRGSFELPPIEFLSSGVPVITPMVPSIEVVDEILLKHGIRHKPFIDLLSGSILADGVPEIVSWYRRADATREKFSSLIGKAFSIYTIQEKFCHDVVAILGRDDSGFN